MRQLLSDLRFASVALRRQPGFAAVVIGTLALGIGANTALFSVVDAVLLRPLPFREPARIVTLWEMGAQKSRVTPADFLDWKRDAKSFSGMSAFNAIGFTLTGAGAAERVGGARVSTNYFDVMGARPVLGRAFVARDEEPGSSPIILGFNLWRTRFHGDASIVGKTVTLDGTAYDVIGVAPAGLYPTWPSAGGTLSFADRTQQVFLPMHMDARRAANRNSHVIGVVARMRDSVTMDDARQEMRSLAHRMASLYPATNAEGSVILTSLESEISGGVRTALVTLLAAVGLLLALACANAASVLLARASAREREIAIRRALGAGRMRIARLLITESLVLALAGGVLGCALAAVGIPAIVALLPQDLPRVAAVAINGQVLAFALLASIGTGITFGLMPALQASSQDPSLGFRDGSAGSGDRKGQRTRRGLVVAQVALALVLVVSGTLIGRSFDRLRQVDPGFKADGVLAFQLVLPSRYAAPAQISAAYSELIMRFNGLPGVRNSAVAYDSPLESNWIDSFEIEGEAPSEHGLSAHLAIVGGSYFEALGVRLLKGRPIIASDSASASGVVVVSQDLASRFFPGRDPIGHWMRLSTPAAMNGPSAPTRFQIVGIADDVHSVGMARNPEPTYYVAADQFPQRDMSVLLRVDAEPLSLLPSVRAEIRRFDDSIALSDPTTLAQTLEAKVAQPRFNMFALSGFAFLALALTAVGLYGLLSYSVARREREIGVRLALGARPDEVRWLVVSEGLRLVSAGGLFGVIGAFVAGQAMKSLLYGIAPNDGLSFAAGASALLLAGTVAAVIPAHRAARVAPASALRHD
ncbi:MAG: ABC transporter permease [Vicinamibacteria bacterium]